MGVLDSGKLKQNQDTAEVTILSENKQPKQKKKHTHIVQLTQTPNAGKRRLILPTLPRIFNFSVSGLAED